MMENLSDRELIDRIVNDEGTGSSKDLILRYFFFEKCAPIFNHAVNRIFNGQVEKDELVGELFCYLQEKEWYKLRQFDYRSKLTTWLSVVATRFFQKKRAELLGIGLLDTLIKEKGESFERQLHRRLDVETLLKQLPNERYRYVIQKLILEDKEPQAVADEMNITMDNLYNIKRRALLQLARIAGKEDGYVG